MESTQLQNKEENITEIQQQPPPPTKKTLSIVLEDSHINNNEHNESSNCSSPRFESNYHRNHYRYNTDESRYSESECSCHNKERDSSATFPLPFLVRAKTNIEKESIRKEYRRSISQNNMTDADTVYPHDDDDDDHDDDHHNEKQQQSRNIALFQFIDKWYRRLSPSRLLENKASVARDHLANERTFLAWLRTSLSLITVGVAISQLFHLHPTDKSILIGKILGGVFVALSILFLYFANIRYFHIQYSMINGHFPASRGAIILGSVSVLAVLIAMFIVIVTDKH